MQKSEAPVTRVLARALAEDMRNIHAGDANAKGPTTTATRSPTTGRPDITNVDGDGD